MPTNKTPPTPENTQSFVHFKLGIIVYSVLLGVVVALIAGGYEISFRWLAALWHSEQGILSALPSWLRYALGPFLACPILYVLVKRIPEQRPYTPADIITGIHIDDGQINAQAVLLSAGAAIFSIGFGFSVGYYAPIVLLGAGAGFLLHRLKWISPVYYYISIGAGAAAAIAAIFHAPIGAVVFVHEVLFRFFSIRAFAPITIAAVTAYVVSTKLFNKAVFFDIAPHYAPQAPAYLAGALAGVLAAVVGVLMMRSIFQVQQFNRQRHWGVMQQLLFAATITAVLVSLVPQAAGSHFQALHQILGGTVLSLGLLLAIFAAKWLATVMVFGCNVPGGIFGPTLFIGTALGALLANTLVLFVPDLADSVQILSIATMAAMLSSVMGAPIAIILIVIEITGDLQIVSVVMLAVVMANITAYRFMGTSSYFDLLLKSRGFNIEAGRDRLYAEHHGIGEIISDNYVALSADSSFDAAQKAMLQADKTEAYIIDESGNLCGRVRLVDVEFYRAQMPDDNHLAAVIQTDPPCLYRQTSIWQAMQLMTQSNSRRLPVVDGENNPKLLGIVDNHRLMRCYFDYLNNLRAKENVAMH